jgi:hypothetical protein
VIDSSASPMPVWRRYGTILLLTVLVLVAGYVIYAKELHHSSSTGSGHGAAALTTPAQPAPRPAVSVSTTIPGGIPVSSRDPFSS